MCGIEPYTTSSPGGHWTTGSVENKAHFVIEKQTQRIKNNVNFIHKITYDLELYMTQCFYIPEM